MSLLEVKNLEVSFALRHGDSCCLERCSLRSIRERLGIVGESGAGKSVTGFAVINLIPNRAGSVKGKSSLMVNVLIGSLKKRCVKFVGIIFP